MKKSYRLPVVVCLVAVGALAVARHAVAEENAGAVFAMTNAASGNQIVAYARHADGSLVQTGAVSTGGNGSGGTVDPLHSQGSLTLSADHRLLFAVNAASGTVSMFAVHGSTLALLDTASSGGSSPTAVAQWGDLVYVLNSGGNGNVAGLRILPNGRLRAIPGSTRGLSDSATSPTSLAFSPNGQFLVVAESATNKIDVFHVLLGGVLSRIDSSASAGAVPFAALFAPNGALVLANASNSVSSYRLNWNSSLDTLSDALPTSGLATCWSVILPNGHAVYTANAMTSNLSGFRIRGNGTLTPIGDTVVGANPAGSANLDTAASADSRFIYTLNGATGTIGVFAVQPDGTLENLTEVEGLPVAAGINGIAAY